MKYLSPPITDGIILATDSVGALVSAPAGSVEITSYPVGTSVRGVSSDASWPMTYGTVFTDRYANDTRGTQRFVFYGATAREWIRIWLPASTAWTAWTEVASIDGAQTLTNKTLTSPILGTSALISALDAGGNLATAPTASTVPSSYPQGSSKMVVSGDASWPMSAGLVETERYSGDGRVIQRFSNYQSGRTWTRTWAKDSTPAAWTAWFETQAVPGAWTAYTPVLTASTTSPTLGSGSATGSYSLIGKTVTYAFKVTFAADSTYGSGVYQISLPYVASGDVTASMAIGTGNVKQGSTHHPCVVIRDNANTKLNLIRSSNEALVTQAGVGTAYASGDSIMGTVTYEAA